MVFRALFDTIDDTMVELNRKQEVMESEIKSLLRQANDRDSKKSDDWVAKLKSESEKIREKIQSLSADISNMQRQN